MQDSFHPELLSGQHVVVTGGGTGLGKAMALRFAELGARVTVCGRRTEPLDETVREIEDGGGAAEGLSCNVREAEAVEAFFDEAEERQGPVTRLVNNAAANFLAASEDLSPNGFDAIIKTNLYGSSNRMFVFLNEQASPGSATEGRYDANQGQMISLQGSLRRLPSMERVRQRLNLSDRMQSMLQDQEYYVWAQQASGVAPSGGGM